MFSWLTFPWNRDSIVFFFFLYGYEITDLGTVNFFYQVWVGVGRDMSKKYSFKGGRGKGMCVKWGEGSPTKKKVSFFRFCDDGISNNKNIPPEYRKKRFWGSKLWNVSREIVPPDPRILLSTQQQLLYPTKSYCMVVKYSQKVKRGGGVCWGFDWTTDTSFHSECRKFPQRISRFW